MCLDRARWLGLRCVLLLFAPLGLVFEFGGGEGDAIEGGQGVLLAATPQHQYPVVLGGGRGGLYGVAFQQQILQERQLANPLHLREVAYLVVREIQHLQRIQFLESLCAPQQVLLEDQHSQVPQGLVEVLNGVDAVEAQIKKLQPKARGQVPDFFNLVVAEFQPLNIHQQCLN